MRIKLSLLLLALGLGLSACKKDDDASPQQKEIIAVFNAAQFAENPCGDAANMKSSAGYNYVYFKMKPMRPCASTGLISLAHSPFTKTT